MKTAIMWLSADGLWRIRRNGPPPPVDSSVLSEAYFRYGPLEEASSKEEAEFRLVVDGYAPCGRVDAGSYGRTAIYVFSKARRGIIKT